MALEGRVVARFMLFIFLTEVPNMKVIHLSGLMFVVFALVLTGGCSGSGKIKTNIVEGTVTYEGQPLAGASVNFSPEGTGDAAFATTDADGKYKLQTLRGEVDAGTTAGDYVVTISKYDEIPTGKKYKGDDGEMYDETTSKPALPETYMNRAKTPFKKTVVQGKNTFDFALKKDGN